MDVLKLNYGRSPLRIFSFLSSIGAEKITSLQNVSDILNYRVALLLKKILVIKNLDINK